MYIYICIYTHIQEYERGCDGLPSPSSAPLPVPCTRPSTAVSYPTPRSPTFPPSRKVIARGVCWVGVWVGGWVGEWVDG